jgi:GNAT superfamily N-acetyltransferase
MDFRIYPLTDTKRLPELCNLFAKGLAETTPEQWLWKHYTPNDLPEGQILVAEDETGVLRGMFAMQPAWYRRGEERILLVQTEDLVIDPEARGQGLMRKLYDATMEQYRQLGAAAITAFSCNEASYPIFLKYGAKNLGDIGALATRKTLLPHIWNPTTYQRDGWDISVSFEMPADVFVTQGQEVFKMEKTPRTLAWKFTENPDRRYQWLTIRKDGELAGWLVFYVNCGRFRSAVNICDWEVKEQVTSEILSKAVKLLQNIGNWVSLWGRQSNADRQRWQAAGFTQYEQLADHFMYHATTPHTPSEFWHITKLDSDN